MTWKISAKQHFAQQDDFCRINIHSIPAGFPLHCHDYVEIVIILSGSGDHLINGKPYPIGSGDVYVLHGNQEHGFLNASPDLRVCNVMFRPELVCFPFERLKHLSGYQALFVLEPARRTDSEFKSLLRLDSIRLKEVLEKVQVLKFELEKRTPGFDSITQAYLLELIVFLSRAYSSNSGNSGQGLLRFSEAVAWMEQNYLQAATVADLACRAAMSERHFLRMFRQAFNVSPLEHLIQLRIRHAQRLLQDGRWNIDQTAHASGFSDSNYFSRQFRRIAGMPPRGYKSLYKKP